MEENNHPSSEEQLPEEYPEVLPEGGESELHQVLQLSGMFENWFLDYASYVILERAVPEILDGFKPVQRRILHAMNELDDGRYNKVANIIGHTMKYHPHGDASIGDALVQLGQKDLLIDTQGNWGNIYTGDSAAAPRYIEARLSKFALEVVFSPKITSWKLSYDGRNKEPVFLPVKFPLLLAQGVEGIAVGLASKILPHNFIELIDASIKVLQGKEIVLYPDFPTGGLADVSKYNGGLRGGKVRLRAKISQVDKRTLLISELPFGTTTETLIDSIVSANEKGKIKIRKIDDNTARDVEILIHLMPGVSPDTTIDALYAFTGCEVSISPNNCIIKEGKPHFITVEEILRDSTTNTVSLLKAELNLRRHELMENLLYASLEKIFIENRIYHQIEECTTWEAVLETIDKALEPFKPDFYREITKDDILRLTEIKIKRISKFNTFKADEAIKNLNDEKARVEHYLSNLTEYAIDYFKNIKRKYGEGRERRTELRSFDTIEAVMVAATNQKLYVNRAEGFAGTGLRKDEYVCDCSDLDDIIVFREDGSFMVTRVAEKVFVGEKIIHIDIFRKNDDRTIYNMVYQDGKAGYTYCKRFAVVGVTRDREYDLTRGKPNSKVLYFTSNPNGESEVIKVNLKPRPKLKKTALDFDFGDLAIKGRSSQGNILTKYQVKKITQAEVGYSTLGALDIWFDESVKRLNTEGRGRLLGAFSGDDKILTIMKSGNYRLYNYDLTNHFDEDLLIIEKFDEEKPISAVYFNAEKEYYYLKRFQVEQTDKKTSFIGEEEGSRLIVVSTDWIPRIKILYDEEANNKALDAELLNVTEFIDVKSHKAKGKRLTTYAVKKIKLMDPVPYTPPVEEADAEVGKDENSSDKPGEKNVQTAPELPSRDKKTGPNGETTQMTIEF
ncbi:MAG: DNA gyrase/topoisomerase IV subunit A [Lentimicrobiaceae bacterium]|nr:DNA gyrase/topoisomerase IV subunit A [Lentimicrobiaceae bacterium]